MKKLFLGTFLLALAISVSITSMARPEVNVSIVLPPPIVFAAPPALIVLPDTYVYVVPDINEDIFFYNGWWWREWEGRWYRSHYYDRGWRYYNTVPSFYFDVDPGWRGYYRDHNWYGHRWNYERIPSQRLQQNWKGWQNTRHWEKQGTWGVQSYTPRPQQQRQELRQQRQQQYQQRPEVQKQRQRQEQSLRFSNLNNNLRRRFSVRKDRNKDLRSSNLNSNLRRRFSVRKDRNKDLRSSNLNSNLRRRFNIRRSKKKDVRRKENLKEGM